MGEHIPDPSPENIDGEVTVVHNHKHGFDWDIKANISHILLAVAILALAYKLHQRYGGDGQGNGQEVQPVSDDAEEIEIEGSGGLVS